MKLQVNSKGSWKDVVSFKSEDKDRVLEAAAVLADADGKWCYVDEFGHRNYFDTQTRNWVLLNSRGDR